MPNAHTHLAAVNDLLKHPAIAEAEPWLAAPEARAAFLMGAISPDVRVVSGHPREATHFFAIPPEPGVLAEDTMLAAFPGLRPAATLDPSRAAFVAGYITHLVMDQTWLDVVVMPGLFRDGLIWGTHHPNWRLYSILMTWLEYRAASRLESTISGVLASARPHRWLPFIEDRHLISWRDHVVEMIRTAGPRRTSEIFAQTNALSVDELEAIVLSEEHMGREAYPIISPEHLNNFEAQTASRSLKAVLTYLARE